MRKALGSIIVAVALAVTACGDDGDAGNVATEENDATEPTDATEQVDEALDGALDEAPPCTELFAPGQTTEQVLAAIGMDTSENMQTGGRCSDEEGDVAIELLVSTTCAGGNPVWYTSRYGYGVAGGTWTAFPEGTSTPPADC